MRLFSLAFGNGEYIPIKYTCDGEDISPPLLFFDIPDETQSFAIIVDDPDAPSGVFTHWIIYDIPGNFEGLPEDVPPASELEYGIKQGVDRLGRIGYNGPCPPPGRPHRYFFILFALDVPTIGLPAGISKGDFLKAIDGHVITQDELVGLYGR
ncbi:YbhB/YbcL family Raf kinase inhibitor-like protein [Desulfurobacterium crinifex]